MRRVSYLNDKDKGSRQILRAIRPDKVNKNKYVKKNRRKHDIWKGSGSKMKRVVRNATRGMKESDSNQKQIGKPKNESELRTLVRPEAPT